MDNKIKNVVECYQCPGCVCGSDTVCYEKGLNEACKKHVAGTIISGIGKIYLGLPRGFCRIGPVQQMQLCIFKTFNDGWGYEKFNIPVWKYKDQFGHTLVRGLSPRVNQPWIHVFLEDCMDQIDCLEIAEKDISEMD